MSLDELRSYAGRGAGRAGMIRSRKLLRVFAGHGGAFAGLCPGLYLPLGVRRAWEDRFPQLQAAGCGLRTA
jgi:hypothetical protein